MYAELQMELASPAITFQQSSNLQGVIMENIDSDYATLLHGNQTNPYSQYVTRTKEKTIWHIQTLTEEAYQQIICPLSKMKEIEIKKKGIVEHIKAKTIHTRDARTLLDEFYQESCPRYLELTFLTPTAFKRDGTYVFYPDLRLIYASLMRKYSEISAQMDMNDEETLDELCAKSEIIKYRLQTVPFPLEKVNITGFVGKICIKVKGPETLARYIRFLIQFGEFSGVGIKTAIGMGAVRYGGKKNE